MKKSQVFKGVKMKNKKTAIIIFGSPKKNGHTAKLLLKFLKELKNYEFTIIDSYKENIHPCIDCGLCKLEEICRYSDLDNLDHLLNTADLLIVATPVYNLSFPAPLKSIFDRMQRYFSARFFQKKIPPIKKEKKAVLLLTSGSKDNNGKNFIETQLKMIFTIINAKLIHTISWSDTDSNTNIEDLSTQIINITKNL